MKISITNLIRPELINLKPYVVHNVPHTIKMDINENPYDMPENIRELIAEEVLRHNFNRYPDPVALELRQSLASELSVDPDRIVVGNGSDELINYTISAFGGNGAGVVFPTPTFSIYGITASLWETKVISVPLPESFEISSDDIISGMKSVDRSIVFISYPNNPTGNCFSRQTIIDILECGVPSIVVIDEAYCDFSGKTFLPLLAEYDNLIIMRTLSKAYGLAGLRVGYMIAGKEIVTQIMKVKMVFNINSLSQRIALILLKHKDQMAEQIKVILQERERLAKRLDAIDGITRFHSDANFILFRVEPDAEVVFSRLIEKGILIRNLNELGLMKNCLRVTVGKPEENNAFLSVLEK
jgi:histidinol-phosphate aminotransferase